MAQAYEKPVIIKLESGHMNKFGSSPYYARKICSKIENYAVEDLVKEFGSPLFVFSETLMRKKYREAYNAFVTRYPQIVFGWSYKTNYLSAVCSVFHQEGAQAEVVSEMEYEKARKLGIPGDQIIFNGPHKSLSALERAVMEGALIHIDHFDEINDLEALAKKTGKKISAALRLNMDTGIYPLWSRFGFNLESGQALGAVKRIASGGHLKVNGLHCHIGTFILDPHAHAAEIRKMIQFGYEIEDRFGFKMDYYDIGGGFPSKNRLKGTYLPPEFAVPSIDQYAEQITTAMFENLRPHDRPKLILESGRALVDEAGWLITSIAASKRLPDGRKAYVADAGVNLLYTSTWYKFNIELARECAGVNEPSIIYGPLCMNIDVVDEGMLLPPLSRGDRLVISPVGAYNVTQWMQFIEYRPAVVLLGKDGEKDVIRGREDLSDIEKREKVPERLTRRTP